MKFTIHASNSMQLELNETNEFNSFNSHADTTLHEITKIILGFRLTKLEKYFRFRRTKF